jgi:hypothetical protein
MEEIEGWMTPEKTNFRTPAAFAASTMATPMSASRGANAGLTWKTPSTPATAARRLAGSARSAITVSLAPRRRATAARSSSRTNARTAAPRFTSSGSTAPALLPVAPTIKTLIHSPL